MLLGMIVGPASALAIESGLRNPIKAENFGQLVDIIADIVLQIGGVVAVIFIIWSGFLFVTAGGSDEKITKAKNTFMWTIVGVAVLLGAKVIASAVVGFIETLK